MLCVLRMLQMLLFSVMTRIYHLISWLITTNLVMGVVHVQLKFYTKFKARYPHLICGLSSFQNLKPWWIRRLIFWNTCCRYHQELLDLMTALDVMRSDMEGVHSSCECNCDMVSRREGSVGVGSHCNVHLLTYEHLTKFSTSIAYGKPDFCLWHKQECLMGDCEACGVKLLRVCSLELTSNQQVKENHRVQGYGND